MKYKNYQSAIHNFAHSFMSIDYMKSGRLAVNVLIDLNNLKLKPEASFDFVNKSILPIEALSDRSKELLKDYTIWLPNHFDRHSCDLTKLEQLEIAIWTDFDKAIVPQGMKDCKEILVHSTAKWKADGRDGQIISIRQAEVLNGSFIRLGIPEFNNENPF